MLNINIKEATKMLHQEVEKKIVLRIKAIRNEADYMDLLKHFYAYFNAVEQAVAPYITPELLPDLADRRNASFIKADIEALGGNLDNLPFAIAPGIDNTAQAMGALYVLEGSIMGGPYIVQMLIRGGLTKGFSFFSGYGEASARKWEAFTAALNALPQNAEEALQATQSACETFARFGDVFKEVKAA